jgi:hypothetical protein
MCKSLYFHGFWSWGICLVYKIDRGILKLNIAGIQMADDDGKTPRGGNRCTCAWRPRAETEAVD